VCTATPVGQEVIPCRFWHHPTHHSSTDKHEHTHTSVERSSPAVPAVPPITAALTNMNTHTSGMHPTIATYMCVHVWHAPHHTPPRCTTHLLPVNASYRCSSSASPAPCAPTRVFSTRSMGNGMDCSRSSAEEES